jgi:hypothetical protein
VDEDEWVRRLSRAVSTGGKGTPHPSNGASSAAAERSISRTSVSPAELVQALRDLEQRIMAIDIRLRPVIEQQDHLIEDVADAVVGRLDARWSGELADEVPD